MKEDDVYRLRRNVKALYRRLERERPDIEGLSATTLHMLVTLQRSPTPLRPGQLAADLEMMDSNVSAALRALEAQGLVALVSDPEDGRRAFVVLTKKARTLVTTTIRQSYNAWLMGAVTRHLNAREQRVLIEASELMARIVIEDKKPSGASTQESEPAMAARAR